MLAWGNEKIGQVVNKKRSYSIWKSFLQSWKQKNVRLWSITQYYLESVWLIAASFLSTTAIPNTLLAILASPELEWEEKFANIESFECHEAWEIILED